MVDEKYIGMALAMASSLLIGTSFVLTKKGLMETTSRYVGLGEFANFAAYSFAPAILVTPLGALSVIVGAILASVFLGERISTVGKAGCALCLMGSVVVVLNAPRDGDIKSIEQIMGMVMQPPFMAYAIASATFLVFMVTRVAGKYGQNNPLVYLSICSIAGSMTVTACKAFGIALKLTFAGNNQFVHLSTYFFAIVVILCIVLQMNYFNKALEQFDTNLVTPIYYVFFTSATILASVALFQGFTDSTNKELASLFCGFFTIFVGVFLLNSTKCAASTSAASGEHQPLPTDEPGFRTGSYSRPRGSQGHTSFDISDFEDNASDDVAHQQQSFPMRERHNSTDFEKKRHSLSRRHASSRPRLEMLDIASNDGETTDVPSSSNNSATSYVAEIPISTPGNDVHIDIPMSPTSLSHRRKSASLS
ncbi:hypothetical protein H4R24_005001 [Coemansia sp. RSA 988]|nr:hypothetical protein H4R24_005001 [Coemansia sp. RSA 988]